MQAAQNDVGVFQGGMFGGSGGSRRTGGDMMGAILGGIVINSLLNGGGGGRSRSGGGFGGLGGAAASPPAVSAAPAAARDAAEVASELGIRSPPPTARSSHAGNSPVRKGKPMAKQSIFGRISTLVKANVNAMLDSAEDPQKMLDQLVRDYTNNIADAESAIAETIGNLRLLERDHEEDVKAAAEWGNKALAASRKADELRGAGNTADADKFDNLAKIALQRQISEENEAKAVAPSIAAQTEVVDKLKDGLNGMKQKLVELKSKRSELLRARRRRSAEQGARRGQVDRRHGPDERARPLRRQGAPPGGARRRQGGDRGIQPRRAVQRARGRRRAHRGRGPPRRAEERRHRRGSARAVDRTVGVPASAARWTPGRGPRGRAAQGGHR
jgi:phage shock protein A